MKKENIFYTFVKLVRGFVPEKKAIFRRFLKMSQTYELDAKMKGKNENEN